MSKSLFGRPILTGIFIGLLTSCSDYGDNALEAQFFNIQGNSLHFVRKTWGITDNHTTLYLLENLSLDKADTLITLAGNNYSFFKVKDDTLFLYSLDIERTTVINRGNFFIKEISLDNPLTMELIYGDNFRKKGLTKI